MYLALSIFLLVIFEIPTLPVPTLERKRRRKINDFVLQISESQFFKLAPKFGKIIRLAFLYLLNVEILDGCSGRFLLRTVTNPIGTILNSVSAGPNPGVRKKEGKTQIIC